MLKEADLGWAHAQGLPCGARREHDLHSLPVRLVQVVELVEPVEEPVLEHEACPAWLAHDARIGDRRRPPGVRQGGEVPRVPATGLYRIPGKIQIRARARSRDAGHARRLGGPRVAVWRSPDEPHARVVEHDVDQRRVVLLLSLVAGRVLLSPQHEDWGESGGQTLDPSARVRGAALARDSTAAETTSATSRARNAPIIAVDPEPSACLAPATPLHKQTL
jgi:hypothetical protein